MKHWHKPLSIFALACALFLGTALNCQAADGQGNNIQLTPEQLEAARQIFLNNYAGMDGTRQALSEKRAQLDDELASPSPDPGRIETLSREIGELRGKMLSARAMVRSQLGEQGLPMDVYGPRPPRAGADDPGVWNGPRRHHGPRGGHHGYGAPGWGCGGCW